MCFVRKASTPMPFERKGEIGFIDFRGCFETDDGSHQVLKKVGLVSVARIFDRDNWPECKLEEEPRHSDFDWISPEDAIEAEPGGEPTASFWELLEGLHPGYEEETDQEDEMTLGQDEQFEFDPGAYARCEKMSDLNDIKQWIAERYGNVIRAMEFGMSDGSEITVTSFEKTTIAGIQGSVEKERQPKEKQEMRLYRHHHQFHRRNFFLGIKRGKRPAQKQRATINDIRREALRVEASVQECTDQFYQPEEYTMETLKFLSSLLVNAPQPPSFTF